MVALRRWFGRLGGRHQTVRGFINWRQARRLSYAAGGFATKISTAWIRLKEDGDEHDPIGGSFHFGHALTIGKPGLLERNQSGILVGSCGSIPHPSGICLVRFLLTGLPAPQAGEKGRRKPRLLRKAGLQPKSEQLKSISGKIFAGRFIRFMLRTALVIQEWLFSWSSGGMRGKESMHRPPA